MARFQMPRRPRLLLQRIVAVLLVLGGIPAAITVGTMTQEEAVTAGATAPRTILAVEDATVLDEVATAQAEAEAVAGVDPVPVEDRDAQAQIVTAVRQLFDQVEDARQPVVEQVQVEATTDPESGEVVTPEPTETERDPTVTEIVTALATQTDLLNETALRDLAELAPASLRTVEEEAVELAQDLAREDIRQGQEQDRVDAFLDQELALRTFPASIAEAVIVPLFRSIVLPTVRIDTAETQQREELARTNVPDQFQSYEAGRPIITEGEVVTEIDMEVLRSQQLLGLDNEGPFQTALRVFGMLAVVVLAVSAFLRRLQPRVWSSGRKMLLLGMLVAAQGVLVGLAAFVTTPESATWWYAIPSVAIAMLVGILVGPLVGFATVLPSTALVLVTFPGEPGLAVFTAASIVVSVPFVTRLASRGDLRSATLRAGLLLPGLAAVTEGVFGTVDDIALAALAAAANGLATVLLVQGLLPFLENLFRLPTVTALLDLADRNHPLLRELESKAMGSYNHSVAVASLVERACREVGANALLGSVAALYHDIGKVRRPHFFIENQRGIANPHDDLEPRVSALIIQDHVKDGVAMAREYKLPPEVVAAIGSHHGTMVVSYFYREALAAATAEEEVDIDDFRYDASKPRSREAAILLLADCCEAATRSMTMASGTMTQEQIEQVVAKLLAERLDDGQFSESDLTFADLYRVRDSIIDALVGIYHPRIAYPDAAPTPAN